MPFPDFPEETNGGGLLPNRSNKANEQSLVPEPIAPEDKENYQKARQSAQRLYLILLAVGLSIGIIASIGVVSFLQRFGLTEIPDRIEQN